MENFRLVISKVRTFYKIDKETKINFIKAYIYSGVARVFIIFMPFNRLRKIMGKYKKESNEIVDVNTHKIAKKIGWAVSEAARYTPWNSKCLVQALTTQRMMKEKGISTTIYLGVSKGKDNEMLAHAWIRCGSYIITGGANKNEYVVVAKFTN